MTRLRCGIGTLAATFVAAGVLSFGEVSAQSRATPATATRPQSEPQTEPRSRPATAPRSRPASAPATRPGKIEPDVPRLAGEVSEYLRQHASNPVHWFPWGPEARETATSLDRPLFISIGYASCHWCHVMRRETFEDADVAALLNAHFVPVKIDREELPDVDAFYMDAVRTLGARGGWPLTIFALPDGTPFFGGTYFPPRTTMGRTGLSELLEVIRATWSDPAERTRILTQAAQLLGRLPADAPNDVDVDFSMRDGVRAFVAATGATSDSENGGRTGAPKFPRARALTALTLAVGAIPANGASVVE